MDRSPPHRRRWRGRAGATALSAGLHGTLLAVLLLGWRTVAPAALQQEIPVSLAPAPLPPAPAPPAPKPTGPPAPVKPAAPAKQATAKPTPPTPPAPIVARRSPARAAPASPPAARVAATPRSNLDQLVDAQLADAEARGQGAGQGAGAGQGGGGQGSGGGGGGECDMAARVQTALRKDPLARAAVHAAGGRSIVIWNGDWVQSGAEDGKGLAAVREAITFEVAFAPPACRRQRVRGLVLLSLNDGSPQVQLGAGEWRWSDLLGLR
jgi:hypothetical protein